LNVFPTIMSCIQVGLKMKNKVLKFQKVKIPNSKTGAIKHKFQIPMVSNTIGIWNFYFLEFKGTKG